MKSKSMSTASRTAMAKPCSAATSARREAAWDKLGIRIRREQPRRRRHLRPRQGRLHRRPRRRRGAFLPGIAGRHPSGARRRPADGHATALPDPARWTVRRGNIVVSRRAILEETRAEQRSDLIQTAGRGPDHRGRGQEHHRLWCVRGPGRHRRPAARHRHELQAHQPPEPRC